MNSSLKRFRGALVLALVLGLLLVQVPNAYSAEWSAPDEALSFLRDVVRLDMTKYNATLISDIVAYPSDFGGLAQEHVTYILESNESKLDALCVFVNNALEHYTLYVLKGSPLFAQPTPTNVVDATKSILQKYQTYTGASYPQAMQDTLNTVTELKTMTTTLGNVKLQVTGGDPASFEWIYTSNGLDFPWKGVRFILSNGHLTSLRDGWNLYKIGSDSVNISREEAIRIAREHAENYTLKIWTGNWTVMNFTIVDEPVKAELSTVASARREPLTLYPFWHVQLYFDKAYGTANGIEVGIWADTGEVVFCQATGIAGGPPAEENPTTPPTEPPPDENPTVPPTEPSPTPQPTPEPSPTPQHGFLGSSLPMEYGYAIVAVIAVAIAAATGYLYLKRKK